MEIETLRWLVSVADGATVGDTARGAHTTQPAVTRALQRIGREVGVPITEPAGRRLRLTFAGTILADAARAILREYDDALRAVSEANDPHGGTVRLGFLTPLGSWLIPQLLSEFHATHPAVRFELRHDGVTRILRALADGELDVALSSAPEDPQLRWEPLFDEELKLAVPAAHRLAGRRRVRVQELADEPWVLFPDGYGMRAHVEGLCRAAGFEPAAAFEGPDLGVLHALIGAGSGVGLFPVMPAPPASVRQIALSPRLGRVVGLVDVPGRVQPRAAVAFAQAVRAYATALTAESSAAARSAAAHRRGRSA